ncbi:DNA-binding FadR family transcriptional regulator [Frigoribacterium endophyticum]|nr:DNA-binding FadR family transcriptional regulator [Frigoribacterium endophyticum]
MLQSLGMVQPRQRTGTQVLPRDSWDLMNPQVIVWRGRGPEYFTQMRELLELRLGLEPVAARLGSQAADAQQITSVRNAARTMVEAAEAHDGPGYLEADVAFHTSLLRGSGNQVIGHFATQVEAILRTRVEEARYTITTWTPAAARQHLDIAEALLGRDADTAGKLTADLIQATIDEFVMEAPRPS